MMVGSGAAPIAPPFEAPCQEQQGVAARHCGLLSQRRPDRSRADADLVSLSQAACSALVGVFRSVSQRRSAVSGVGWANFEERRPRPHTLGAEMDDALRCTRRAAVRRAPRQHASAAAAGCSSARAVLRDACRRARSSEATPARRKLRPSSSNREGALEAARKQQQQPAAAASAAASRRGLRPVLGTFDAGAALRPLRGGGGGER
ncbi:hypothetical protein FA09DRAFT_258129 [Tilletiopsis washingtonensis]|uniref:Uncharacterized protein n=1 Tax=Tilletiopsis washingtonensis TaxID=58919 RepID=A0A316ZC44_9BASI|nr:hypothetical protein FA09DRAFT_258129 [Tilletiopsis washingtonensis]PWN98886.1 hypothetical protein FA09DRAFT_258129 [Tilletiopsis washingtonensis]